MAEPDRLTGGVAASALEVAPAQAPLSDAERDALSELFAVIAEREPRSALPIDKAKIIEAYRFAGHQHRDQRRRSGEEFISHPVSVATICAGLGLDTESLVAALLHDTVEDTTASLEQIDQIFGAEVAALVDGVTKLDALSFKSLLARSVLELFYCHADPLPATELALAPAYLGYQ